MESKIKIFIITVSAIIESFTLKSWLVCKDFSDIFHFSSSHIALQLEDYVHTEKGTPLFLTRVFNNKLVDTIIYLARLYLQFWDVRFGSNWFSFIGYFSIIMGVYYIIANKKKKLIHWVMLAVIIVLPWIEIIADPAVSLILKTVYFWIPFILFSFYGLYQFLSHGIFKRRLIIVCVLLIISLWWLAFLNTDMQRYCV